MPPPHYLLVGGSNCVLKDGYGAALQQQLPGEWRNESLGNSSSLRGVEYLLSNQALIRNIDRIFFEYALNDLIFEASNTLDPLAHLDWLRSLVAVDEIRNKLIFVLLHGQGASARIASGHSFVADHYRKIIEQFGVCRIDLFPLIAECARSKGAAAVFKDNDHFSPNMVQELAAHTLREYPLCVVQQPVKETSPIAKTVVVVDPVWNAPVSFRQEFRTTLVALPVVRLAGEAEIRVTSPGGRLVGFYAVATREAACVRIAHQGREIVKAVKHRFGMLKPYLTLQHLTTPLHAQVGEDIVIRHARDIFSVPNATLDHTMAQVINKADDGSVVDVGKFIFLV